MKLLANQFGLLQGHRSATPVLLGSQRSAPEGGRSMRVSGRSCFSLSVCTGGFLSGAQPSAAAQFRPALLATSFRLASALASRFVLQSHAEKPAPSSSQCSNPALNPVRFALWTLRDKAAQRRLALR